MRNMEQGGGRGIEGGREGGWVGFKLLACAGCKMGLILLLYRLLLYNYVQSFKLSCMLRQRWHPAGLPRTTGKFVNSGWFSFAVIGLYEYAK